MERLLNKDLRLWDAAAKETLTKLIQEELADGVKTNRRKGQKRIVKTIEDLFKQKRYADLI